MNTTNDIQSLEKVLDIIRKKELSFSDVCDLLFTFKFEDFDEIFGLSEIKIPAETSRTIPIIQAEYLSFLKIWGVRNYSTIRDHSNCDSVNKILKGSLTEVNYRENSNFIEYDLRTTHRTGDLFIEEKDDINSLVNNSEEISISLHSYRTSKTELEGVRIFDTENRKIGYLSKEAKSCTWTLPENAFRKIVKV
ncbi:hypothetical protein FNJ88_01530 [Chryseobacterium sp. SNU WT5]|uniref:hypothetical protein n=1 Tax=Chryseobacterium sp. SNU WT5 TaxID=2594269 RepID=UPI00117F12E0|nr:hypothetical protein [Chryseobacterium sp. SNU WT5]QDP84297.1 hypothetical protein FNJ88_01530 [Chryseobacterium sp. SNU WT5]